MKRKFEGNDNDGFPKLKKRKISNSFNIKDEDCEEEEDESESDSESVSYSESDTEKEEEYPKIYLTIYKNNFIFQKELWTPRFNLSKNKNLQLKIFNKNILLKKDIFAFSYINQIGCAININEKTLIFGYEKENTKRTWLISELNGIKELILTKQNYLHEVILDLPIRMFLDIEYDIKNFINFKKQKQKVINLIGIFKEEYKKYLESEFEDFLIKDDQWLILDASKKTKVSFHVIGYHSNNNNKPIYYKNIYHLKLVIKKVLEKIPKKNIRDISIDECFYFKKPLRMYYCCHRNEPNRIFTNYYRENKEFNDTDFFNSILQLYSNIDYFQIEMIDNFENEEYIKNTLKFNYKTKIKSLLPSPTILLPRDVNGFAELLLKSLLNLLINIKNICYQNNKYNFEFLKKYKDEFSIYRVKKSKDNPLTIFIDVNGCEMCLLQNYKHNHLTGRRIILVPNKKILNIWCAAGNNIKNHKNNYFSINISSWLSKRFDVKRYYDIIVKKSSEIEDL